jgi:glycosyltransferase involved in cell wall biosynthesis
MLSAYDLIVIDPKQAGVLELVTDQSFRLPPHVVARLDLYQMLSSESRGSETSLLRSMERILTTIESTLKPSKPGGRNAITGFALAGWHNLMSTVLLNALAQYLQKAGLRTYLEVVPPHFLDGDDKDSRIQYRAPNLGLFSGVILRNGTVLPSGEVRDFFQMERMRSTTREFVSQSCQRQFTVMMWDPVDDRIEVSHAVVKRAFAWCGYHGAILWLGSDAGLTQSVANIAVEEPLASFQWLKDQKVMKIHEAYRKNRHLTSKVQDRVETAFEEVETLVPAVRYLLDAWNGEKESGRSTLTLEMERWGDSDKFGNSTSGSDTLLEPRRNEWIAGIPKYGGDPLSISPIGTNYTGLGCFPIGLQVSEDSFAEVVKSQRRLRKLGLLSQLASSKVRDLAIQVHGFLANSTGLASLSGGTNGPNGNHTLTIRSLREFADLLGKASDLDQLSDPVQIYTGIDSGFHTAQQMQFWSVYEIDRRSGALVIYVSKDAQNVTSTIMHTYLSSRGLSRYHCLLVELDFNKGTGSKAASGHNSPGGSNGGSVGRLPDRLRQDFALLSPTDLLLFLQQFKFAQVDESCSMLLTIRSACQELLLDVPTFEQLKELGNVGYLDNSISTDELIDARINWYRQHGFDRLGAQTALDVFTDVHFAFRDILHLKQYENLDALTSCLEAIVLDPETGDARASLDPYTDILVFAVFCAARKAAFEEVYVEVCDRNPLFNEYSDQSAAFAELFALGSRSEAYFDLSPSAFGKLLSQRYREYYSMPQNQPPMWIHNAPAFASSYAAAQTDIDPHSKDTSSMPGYRRFTFLSVFAIPALIDITLLTTTGRGLYLSAYMNPEEQHYATLALMISLLLSGAIGTWIAIGGSYYLISMAFSAANMFVLTRLLGGLSVTLLIGFIGGAIITGLKGFHSGVIFFFYLVALTAYLSVLAALSSYQFPGSSFLNGRTVIIVLIPTLLLSPIITSFIPDHDSLIYLSIIYVFIILLVLGLRRAGSLWVTWLTGVFTIEDAAVKAWYIENRASGNPNAYDGLTDPAAMNLARESLASAVQAERKLSFWQSSKADSMVQKLAKSWDATIFLLDWYCRLQDVKKPMPYSSTWNIEVRVAYDSLMQNQKGIRLHNSFIHWRNAGDEVGAGILYFLVALLDRWVELIIGGPLTGLSVVPNLSQPWLVEDEKHDREQRALSIAVGFGLAYYLIGAVLLDYKAQHLHQVAAELAPITIQSKEFIRAAEIHDAKIRQKLYWKTLMKFLGVHVWALSLCAALVWVFDSRDKTAFFTFLAYVGAYSGLLLYQYNKIFSGPHAIMPLLVAVLVGLPVGFLLKTYNKTTDGYLPYYEGGPIYPRERDFAYNGVIALGVATWIACLLSFKTAKIGLPKKQPLVDEKSHKTYHAYGGLGIDQKWSQTELEAFYEGVVNVKDADRLVIKPTDHPGTEIKALLLSCNEESLSAVAIEAFPLVNELVRRIVASWDRGLISVELVSMSSVIPPEADVRALSFFTGGRLQILVEPGKEQSSAQGTIAGRTTPGGSIGGMGSVSSNCKVIAETLIHAAAEHLFGLIHEHALISESFLVCRYVNEEMTRVPERLRRALPNPLSPAKKNAFLYATKRELLRYLLYGLPCDTTWDFMPMDIRRHLLQRCMGEPATALTASQLHWLETNMQAEQGCLLETRMARYDLGAILAVHKFNYFKKQAAKQFLESPEKKMITNVQEDHQWLKKSRTITTKRSFGRRFLDAVKKPFSRFYNALGKWLKFAVIAPIADPEYQRELICILSRSNRFIRRPIRYLYTGLWIFARNLQALIIPWFIFKGRSELKDLWKSLSGTVISIKPGRLTITSYDKTLTAFIHKGTSGAFKLFYYTGILDKEPQDGLVLAVASYSKEYRLTSKEDFVDGISVNEYVYEYPARRNKREPTLSGESTRIPLSRICVRGDNQSATVQYNHKGFIESGSYVRHGNLVRFKYHYRKNAKFDDELLRAEFVLPHLSCNVSWAAPPVRHPEKPERWIPHSRVQEATFVQGSDVYECVWVYNHQYHPVINTKLNGYPVDTPEMIRHDWLGLLKKPTGCSFIEDNPLLNFPRIRTGYLARFISRFNTKLLPASTSQKRSQLWKIWKKRSDIDGVVIRWLDERLLREDPLLKPYWRKRDRGALIKAEDYLALHADTIMASSELSNDISAWTPLAIRLGDLFSFGQGGDAVVYTRTKTLQPDTEDTLHVIAVDTGTWPNEGGGVSACRRDLINNLRTIRWNMVVESANDFGLPKHQTQENVESLKVIPLWGLDFMHPVHGMFFNKLDSEVDHLIKDATRDDIRSNFLPTLTALVQGARAVDLSDADVKQATRAFVNLNTYFQDSRHWKEVWESDTVKEAWRHLWLADDIPNTKPPSQWFDTERPTLGHLDSALELWFRHLFIFSIPIPERVPAVFQASHHSVSAAYGMVCKIKRNCVLQIWDHAISWRETNLYLSSALCTLPPFVRNSLLGLMRLTSMLTLHHADYILPCADFFNPGWEIEIGTSQGHVEHRNVFKRKIDPIVNGITDMQKFSPVTEIKSKKPTVTMLSHVWFAKDIKTALLAADIIVHQWGFTEYQLDIYGALNKAPIYSSECQEIIATKGLAPNVTLRGTADPAMVLSKTWLFLNSSVSEGLPLALGEAALTGAPVVCTDVGASLRVLTHPESNERYSEIVAPNDPLSLARAQINLLAMLGQWTKYANDDPVKGAAPILPIKPTSQDVEIITARMYSKSAERRALGMMARSIVQESFSGERYLREHEQMLWVGKARWESYGVKSTQQEPPAAEIRELAAAAAAQGRGGARQGERTYAEVVDAQLDKMAHPRTAPAGRSFTSIYTDIYSEHPGPAGPDSGSGNYSGAAVQGPNGAMVRNGRGNYSNASHHGQSGDILHRSLSFQARYKDLANQSIHPDEKMSRAPSSRHRFGGNGKGDMNPKYG